jgi:hypothetical protein
MRPIDPAYRRGHLLSFDRLSVSPTSDLICLLHPRSKCLVELPCARNTKLMDEEALGVWRHPHEPLITHLPWQIEESIEREFAGLGTGEAAVGPFEGDRRLGHVERECPRCSHQGDETFVEVDDFFGFIRKMPLDAPIRRRDHLLRVATPSTSGPAARLKSQNSAGGPRSFRWSGPGSIRRPHAFQARALPTELPDRGLWAHEAGGPDGI